MIVVYWELYCASNRGYVHNPRTILNVYKYITPVDHLMYYTYVMNPEVFVIFSSKYENPRGCANGRRKWE